MSVEPRPSLLSPDRADVPVDAEIALGDLLDYAAKSTGWPGTYATRAFRRVENGPGRLTFREFVRYGLHRAERLSTLDPLAFVSDDLQRPIARACNDGAWVAACEDKVLSATILEAGGVPVPRTTAVLDRSARDYPGIAKLATPEEARGAVAATAAEGGAFCKPLAGIGGRGAFEVIQADDAGVLVSGAGLIRWEDFLGRRLEAETYLLQERLRNHPTIAAWTGALATVHTVTILGSDGAASPFAVLALPQHGNVADTFRRAWNLACAIDVDTGQIVRIARNGRFEIDYLDDHPKSPGLMGLEIPHWQRLRAMVETVAGLFAPLRCHSTDIAITPDGPVAIGVGFGGSMALVQSAYGEGFLRPEVRELFDECGALTAPAPRREGRAGLFGRFGFR